MIADVPPKVSKAITNKEFCLIKIICSEVNVQALTQPAMPLLPNPTFSFKSMLGSFLSLKISWPLQVTVISLFTLLWAEVWPVGWCEGRPLREPRMELNPSPHGRAPRAKDNNRTLCGSSRGLAAVGIMKQNPRPNRTRVGCREPHRGRGHGMWCGLPCLGTYGGQRSPLSCNVTGSHSERH